MSGLAYEFYQETERGIDIFIPAGLDEGIFARLESGRTTFYEKDGGSSDNRLILEPYYGRFEVVEDKLLIYREGVEEPATFNIQPAPPEAREHKLRYCLMGGGLSIGWAPVDLDAELDRTRRLQGHTLSR